MSGTSEYFLNKTKSQYYGYHFINFYVSSTLINSLSKINNNYFLFLDYCFFDNELVMYVLKMLNLIK